MRSGAMPSAASGAVHRSSSSRKRSSAGFGSHASSRVRYVRTASWRSGETRQPSAEKAPEWAGTTTRPMPACRASAPAWMGPAPP